eukprot:1157319-Pelagomonas_calceolata.AAC.8
MKVGRRGSMRGHAAALDQAGTLDSSWYFSIPELDDYYRKKDAKPLIFCHFARGLADKTYDEVPDYASLYKTLMEALNGE